MNANVCLLPLFHHNYVCAYGSIPKCLGNYEARWPKNGHSMISKAQRT